MPAGHRQYAEWSAEHFLSRARQFGPSTEALIAAILADRRHPEQGYRSCQGVLKLFRGANEERAEAVSARALAIGALGGRSIASILENNLDRQPAAPTAEAAPRCTPTSAAHATSIEVLIMLTHPTLDLLHELGLEGCARGFKELAANPAAATLDHAEWLGVLLEHEVTRRNQKLYESRARRARLRHLAVIEDVDYRAARGLDKALFLKLGSCGWVREHRNLILTGPSGVGKTWLACALGNQACRENLSVLYVRASRLFADLALGRGDGRYTRLLRGYGKADLMVLDDWGPEPLGRTSAATCWRSSKSATAGSRC